MLDRAVAAGVLADQASISGTVRFAHALVARSLEGELGSRARTGLHARAYAAILAGITGTARGGELSHFPYADPEGCARTIAENPDLAIGVKLRFGPGLVWEYSAEPVKVTPRM